MKIGLGLVILCLWFASIIALMNKSSDSSSWRSYAWAIAALLLFCIPTGLVVERFIGDPPLATRCAPIEGIEK